ncbi:hypothetical protein ACFLTB_03340 [Chloroflexota bacterium]
MRSIPGLAAWLTGIVVAVIMVRRGGGKPEKLLLIGCSLMLFTVLASPILRGLIRYWMSEKDVSNLSAAAAMAWVSIPMAVLSLAGIVCLLWAFWVKFRIKRQETA